MHLQPLYQTIIPALPPLQRRHRRAASRGRNGCVKWAAFGRRSLSFRRWIQFLLPSMSPPLSSTVRYASISSSPILHTPPQPTLLQFVVIAIGMTQPDAIQYNCPHSALSLSPSHPIPVRSLARSSPIRTSLFPSSFPPAPSDCRCQSQTDRRLAALPLPTPVTAATKKSL